MDEYLFDVGLLIIGAVFGIGGWWLLIHLSDRRILRRLRPPWIVPIRGKVTHDETVAQRSLFVGFAAMILIVIGTLNVLAGIVRLFGFGR